MSLKEINARARVPSGLRYRARLSGIDGAASFAAFFDFLGDEKKARIPPLDIGAAGGWAVVGTMVLNMEMM